MTSSVGAETPIARSQRTRAANPMITNVPMIASICGPLPATMLSLQLAQKILSADQVVVEDLTGRV